MPERPRMELEARLKCLPCDAAPYVIYRRQNQQANGELLPTFENVVWPVHPDVAPPVSTMKLVCPDCGTELRRVAP